VTFLLVIAGFADFAARPMDHSSQVMLNLVVAAHWDNLTRSKSGSIKSH
jgi:hypothetical protein